MILAPLQGLTEVLFRRVYEECFPGAIARAVSPFLSLTHNIHHSRGSARQTYLADVLPENNAGSIAVIPQILGREAEEFVELAGMLADMGYTEVNWNIGCPMRAVTGKHRGSGILPYPEEVRQMLDAVVPRLRCRLSIKTRLGLREKEEIFKLVPIFNDYPIATVTIHPRTGKQQYGGQPDLEVFGQVMPMLKAPVVYNGDICTKADAERIRTLFPGISEVMIGRGVLYDPTLPLRLRGDTLTDGEAREKSRHFVRRMIEEINLRLPSDEMRTRKTKEYWALLWKTLPISELQARSVLRAQELAAVDNLIEQFIQ